MATHRITLLPGDGIGPEITGAVVKILESAGLDVVWDTYLAGATAVAQHGTTLPPELLESIKHNGVALKGPITTPVGGGFKIKFKLKGADLVSFTAPSQPPPP